MTSTVLVTRQLSACNRSLFTTFKKRLIHTSLPRFTQKRCPKGNISLKKRGCESTRCNVTDKNTRNTERVVSPDEVETRKVVGRSWNMRIVSPTSVPVSSHCSKRSDDFSAIPNETQVYSKKPPAPKRPPPPTRPPPQKMAPISNTSLGTETAENSANNYYRRRLDEAFGNGETNNNTGTKVLTFFGVAVSFLTVSGAYMLSDKSSDDSVISSFFGEQVDVLPPPLHPPPA